MESFFRADSSITNTLVPLILLHTVDWSATQLGNNTMNFGYNGVLQYYPDYNPDEETSTMTEKKTMSSTTTDTRRPTPPVDEATAYYEEPITYKFNNVTSANTNFGLLAAAAFHYKASYVCSPVASMIPLAILYVLGPRNRTCKNQFHAALTVYEPGEVIDIYSSLLPDLNTQQERAFIELGGQVFISDEYELVRGEHYARDILLGFGSLPIFVDFEEEEEAAEAINQWIRNTTNEFIGNIFRPKDIDTDTEILIFSVLYFQCSWKRKFDYVNMRHFYGEVRTKVPMMRIPNYPGLKYGDTTQAQLLELPINEDMHMLIVLPKQRGGLHDLMNCYGNNTRWLTGDINSMFIMTEGIDVRIPRFRINSVKFDVKDIYENGMKMDSIFSKKGQKYKGISPNAARVKQAFQTVSMVIVNSGYEEPNRHTESGVIEFSANHPFYFVVFNADLELVSGMYLGD